MQTLSYSQDNHKRVVQFCGFELRKPQDKSKHNMKPKEWVRLINEYVR